MNNYFYEDKNYLVKLAKKLGFSNKTFLISGATGMIGQILVDSLLEITNPSNVIVLGKDFNDCTTVFGNKGLVFASFDTLCKINKKTDYVIHLASPTNSEYLTNNPSEVIDFIYTSTKLLLDFCKLHVSTFLFVSSMEVYGEIFDDKKRNENELGYISLIKTRNSYPEVKRLCELLVKSYVYEYGIKAYTARLSQTFGAGTSINDQRVFGYFARCAINGDDIVLKTTGETYGNYCYISDTISAFFYILAKGDVGETYNVVGDNTRMTILEMAHLVSKKIADNNIKVLISTDSSAIYPRPTKLNMDNSKLKAIGWTPCFDVLDMFKRMIG